MLLDEAARALQLFEHHYRAEGVEANLRNALVFGMTQGITLALAVHALQERERLL